MSHSTKLNAAAHETLRRAVEARGLEPVARALGISREAVARLVANITTRPGTVALAERGIPLLVQTRGTK